MHGMWKRKIIMNWSIVMKCVRAIHSSKNHRQLRTAMKYCRLFLAQYDYDYVENIREYILNDYQIKKREIINSDLFRISR
jgi:hypothetical protein